MVIGLLGQFRCMMLGGRDPAVAQHPAAIAAGYASFGRPLVKRRFDGGWLSRCLSSCHMLTAALDGEVVAR